MNDSPETNRLNSDAAKNLHQDVETTKGELKVSNPRDNSTLHAYSSLQTNDIRQEQDEIDQKENYWTIKIVLKKDSLLTNGIFYAVIFAAISIFCFCNCEDPVLYYYLSFFFITIVLTGLIFKKVMQSRQSLKNKIRLMKETLIKIINDQSNLLQKSIKELHNECFLLYYSELLMKTESDFKTFVKKAIADVSKVEEEIQHLNTKFNLESSMKDFQRLIQEIRQENQKKNDILKNMKMRYNDNNIQYCSFLKNITISEKDYMDLENLNAKVEQLKKEVSLSFKNYHQQFQNDYNAVEQSAYSLEDEKHFYNTTNISSIFSKELEKKNDDLTQLLTFFSATAEGKLARDVRNRSNFIKEINGLKVYKLPIIKIHEDARHNFRHFSIGKEIDIKPFKVIMMTGMTGAGKSLMINNIVNYVYGVNFRDEFRLQLIIEEEEIADRHPNENNGSLADSMTRWISSYTFHYEKGFRVPFNLVLIDTPGFGDTRGVNFDENIEKNIKEFFSNKVQPINELSSIGFVIQASQSRVTAEQNYIFNTVLNIFGNNVNKNICLLFTFADAQPPPALITVKKEGIPFPEDGVFKFNNSSVYAETSNESNYYYWKFGFQSLQKYFLHVSTVEPASLSLTKEVLKEKQNLYILLDGAQKKINNGFETLQSIENTTQIVMELKGEMRANKGFKVKKVVHPQQTKVVEHFITNCKVCMFTCHDPCDIAGDIKKGCASMSQGKCVQCPGYCPWDSHSNGDRIYIYTKVEVEETIQDMLDKYSIAVNDKRAKIKVLQNLLNDYNIQKQLVFKIIQDAGLAAKRLEEISLGKSLLSSVAYIERLIESERRSNKPNKANRISQLQHFKDRAILLSNARADPLMNNSEMGKYEKTVMTNIDKLENMLSEDEDEYSEMVAQEISKHEIMQNMQKKRFFFL